MNSLINCYDRIIADENLWLAWKLFRRGKRKRADVREFERRLEDSLLSLRQELANGTYQHGQYRQFTVHDPKRRIISAPQIRDQIVHQAIWNVLFPHFDARFSSSVHSCRPGRGTHSAVGKISRYGRCLAGCGKVWILHIDVIKFFDSVDHAALRENLRCGVSCPRTMKLLDDIIGSYRSGSRAGRGIPLGNLTSQLFCNVMLMPIDRWIDGGRFCRLYARYADDLFVLGNDRSSLDEFARQALGKFAAVGLCCRFRVVRFTGFEALGKRFFYDGMAIKRSTAVRAVKKLGHRVDRYNHGVLGISGLNSTKSSFLGLVHPANDPRWTKRLSQVILEKL
jgi:RNA-directed DNA polymerase